MRIIYLLSITILLIGGCTAPEESAIPEGLEEKRAMLTDKKKASKALLNEIAELEVMIQEQSGVKPEDSYPLVALDTLKQETFTKYLSLPASVSSDDMVNLSSEMGGRILKLNAEEGRYVKKGSLIASLDNESVRFQKSELETRLELAKTIFEKQKRLWNQKIGSEIQFLEAKNNKEALEKSLATLNTQIAKFNAYAPISGVIDTKFVKLGEVVGPGQPIVSILNTSRMKVVTDVPENYLKSVKRGDNVEVYFPALDETRKARISLIGAQINAANRSFKVEVDLNNSKGTLKPNLLAELRLKESETKDAIVLPINFIQEEVGGKKYVYVLDNTTESPKAAKRIVKTGDSYENSMIITEGLKTNDIIITTGLRDLNDGQGLRLDN